MGKLIKRWAKAMSSLEGLAVGNTIGIAVNVLAIAMNAYTARHSGWAAIPISVSTLVISGQLWSLHHARMRGRIWAQERAEAVAKRKFAEMMIAKLQSADGITMGIQHDDDTDKMKRH